MSDMLLQLSAGNELIWQLSVLHWHNVNTKSHKVWSVVKQVKQVPQTHKAWQSQQPAWFLLGMKVQHKKYNLQGTDMLTEVLCTKCKPIMES